MESHAESELSHSLYDPHENRRIERRVRKRHPKINRKARNLKGTKDSTRKMSDMPKGLTSAMSPRGGAVPTIGQTEINILYYRP